MELVCILKLDLLGKTQLIPQFPNIVYSCPMYTRCMLISLYFDTGIILLTFYSLKLCSALL